VANVFISYSTKDRAYVRRLAEFLESRGLTVWYDLDLIPYELWEDAIEREITACDTFILVMSPAAARSTWVRRERHLAEKLHKRLAPLWLKGRPFWTVSERQHEDVRGGVMPSDTFVTSIGGRPAPSDAPSTGAASRADWRVNRRTLLITGAVAAVAGVSYLAGTRLHGNGQQAAPSPTDSPGPSMSATETAVADPSPTPGAAASSTSAAPPRSVKAQLLHTLADHTDDIYAAVWSPDSSRLATAGLDGIVRIWDAVSGSLLKSCVDRPGDAIFDAAWSPDGRHVATGSGLVAIWDPTEGTLVRTLAENDSSTKTTLAWSPDSTRLATGAANNTAKVWDATTGALLHTIQHSGFVGAVAWSPDGTRLATGSYDDTCKIWNTANWSLLFSLSHASAVDAVSWSRDGSRLATACWDNTASVWNTANGSRLRRLTGHAGLLTGVAWSPDGQLLATASYDQTARVWDAAAGTTLATLPAATTYGVRSVTWSPDGTRIAVARDPAADIWRIDRG